MKIPYIISKDTIQIYQASPQTLQLIGENLRKLVAENFEWDKNRCPSLEDFCVQAIAKHFEQKPILDELPCYDRISLLDILPLDLPLEFSIPLVVDEYYWERRYKVVFKYTWRTKPQNWTWKSQYLERHCQKLCEEAQPQYNDEETFDEILALCSPFVTRLFVEELQPWKPPLTMEKEDIPEIWPTDHINFLPILKKLSNLQELDVIFGTKNVGEDFKWDMFKVTPADCNRLGKAVQELNFLKILRIHRSALEHKHMQELVSGLIKCPHLEVLDLSHCPLSDAGVLCVAYLLTEGTSIKILNLTDTGMGKIGAEGIGYALLQGKANNLQELNLRLNPLGHEGAMGIMRALVRCSIPEVLSMAACQFEEDTPTKLCWMLELNESLKRLDISSNWLGEEIGEKLVESVGKNTCIEWLDLRETDISKDQLEMIQLSLIRNRKAARITSKLEIAKKEHEEFTEFNFTLEE